MIPLFEKKNTSPAVKGLVMDVDHFAVHDGPGIRTAVYLKGCSLHCMWCHSPESRKFTPELAYLEGKCTTCGLCLITCPSQTLSVHEIPSIAPIGIPGSKIFVDWEHCNNCGNCLPVCYPGAFKQIGRWVSVEDLFDEIEGDIPFFTESEGGVTLTGGEATSQPEFSYQFLAKCRSKNIHTILETNGCAPWKVFRRLAKVVNLFLYDIKHMDNEQHRLLTGVSNLRVHANLRHLTESGSNVIVRIPCIPGINDDVENIKATVSFILDLGLNCIHLLPYNENAGAKYNWIGSSYPLKHLKMQNDEQMEKLANICRSYGINTRVGS